MEGLRLQGGLSEHSGSMIRWIGEGYIGLVDHLCGHFDSANERYAWLIRNANERKMLRLVSIFNRHKADLTRSLHDPDGAVRLAELAVNAAMQAEQRDILHAARLSLAKAKVHQTRMSDHSDLSYAENALAFAEEMGTPRLEAEALIVQADAMMGRGERVMAGQTAARAAAVAARGGMRLHKVRALHIYARAVLRHGERELARGVLLEARAEAQRFGFQTRAGRMSDLLTGL